MVKIQICNIRITGNNKAFYMKKLQEFADCMDEEKVAEVQYGKKDIRGGISIALIDHSNCIPKQKFFNSKDEMLGYVQGFCDDGYDFDQFVR